MASEEDTFELDEHGKGLKDEFDSDGFYSEPSEEVLATVAGIYVHTIKHGEFFRLRARMEQEEFCAALALFVTVCTLCKIFVRACRSMNEAQPVVIQDLFKMIRKFFRDGRKN